MSNEQTQIYNEHRQAYLEDRAQELIDLNAYYIGNKSSKSIAENIDEMRNFLSDNETQACVSSELRKKIAKIVLMAMYVIKTNEDIK